MREILVTMHRKRKTCADPSRAPRRRPRVLVVDDDLVLCVFQAELLADAGFEVDIAEDGEIGWQALQAETYDLLITDNQMPRVSGIELLKKIRSEGQDVPAIMVSGSMPTEEIKRYSGLRLSATLLKPFKGAQLLETVGKILLGPHKRRRAKRAAVGPLRKDFDASPVRTRVPSVHSSDPKNHSA